MRRRPETGGRGERRTTSRWRTQWALVGVVTLYLITGTAYSVVVPVFEAPDESFHFFVVRHIAAQRSLPVQQAGSRGEWEQEGSQPPLYYLIGATLVGWMDLSDAEDLLWVNPQANVGDPNNPGNKNRFVHRSAQAYPWRGAVLAVHVLRLFSLSLGAATVVLVWRTVRLVHPRQETLALAVAAVTAFIPQFLSVTAAVNNDSATALLSAVLLYMLLARLRDGGLGRSPGDCVRRWGGVGVVLGLALLAKLSAVALVGLTVVVVALCAWRQRTWRALRWVGPAIGVPVIAIAGWWYIRNLVLYGEPTGLSAMWEVVGRREGFGTDLWGEFRGLRYSFWGLFGWLSIPLPTWAYRVLDTLSALALAGVTLEVWRWLRIGLWRGAWSAWRHREPGEAGMYGWGAAYTPLALGVMALWLGTVLVSLVRWTSLTPGTQGRLLYPAIGPIILLFVLGLRTWFLPQVRDRASTVLAVCGVALGVATPWSWIAPEYARPAELDGLPESAIPLDVRFGESIRLRGVGYEREVVRPGETLKVNLYWETTRPLREEGEVMVSLGMVGERSPADDPTGGVVGVEDAFPGSGTLPVSLWPVGRLIAGRQFVRVGDDAPAPMIARIDVGLYRLHDGERLTAGGLDVVTIGRIKVVPRRWPRARAQQAAARFDCGVSLASHDVQGTARPGEELSVRLVWSVQSAPGRDYTVFVHLEDGDGSVWGYGDGAPRGGDYPTWAWDAGEVVVDEHLLKVPADAPPGRYPIKVGLYDAGGRVPAYGADGVRWSHDAVDLEMVEIR